MYKFIFFIVFNCFAQEEKMFSVVDKESNIPINRASIYFLSFNDTIAMSSSDENGNFTIPKKIKYFEKIRVTHVSYNPFNAKVKDLESSTFYLVKNNYELEELKIKSKKRFKWNPLPFKTNLDHNEMVATLIVDKKSIGNRVKKIKAEVTDIFGVRNLKYLPFRLQLREVNPETNLPDKLLFRTEIITKRNSKKWFEFDVTGLNINLPETGLYVVFEVLNRESYQEEFINSRVGVIVAVPQLKTKRKNNKHYNSYRLKKCYNNTCIEKWEIQKDYYFNLKLEF